MNGKEIVYYNFSEFPFYSEKRKCLRSLCVQKAHGSLACNHTGRDREDYIEGVYEEDQWDFTTLRAPNSQ
jgi:hypothetical protein